jgi:hypothetical protein
MNGLGSVTLSLLSNLRRWRLLLGDEPTPGASYRVAHDRLLFLAKNYPLKKAGQTVTDFTDWIFRLYVPERDYSSLLRGQQIEREIATLRVPAPVHSRWKLEYNGMSGTDSEAFEISTLKINGTPLRGKPDLVFREKGTKRILIVEVKTSEADILRTAGPICEHNCGPTRRLTHGATLKRYCLSARSGFQVRTSFAAVYSLGQGDQILERENAELFACYSNYCESIGHAHNAIGT